MIKICSDEGREDFQQLKPKGTQASLGTRQSGFRKNHSTDTALIQVIDELLFNLDKNRVSGVVLVDYCKAFDMVDHGLLLDKLKVYGVAGETMK